MLLLYCVCIVTHSLTHSFPYNIYNTTWTWRYFLFGDEWGWYGMSSTYLLYCILTVLYCTVLVIHLCHPSVHIYILISIYFIQMLLPCCCSILYFICSIVITLLLLPPFLISSVILHPPLCCLLLLYIRVVGKNCILFIWEFLVT